MSKQSDQQFEFEVYLDDFQNCCAISIWNDFHWYSDQASYPCPTVKHMIPIIKRELKSLTKKCTYATVSTQYREGRNQIKAMKLLGWKVKDIVKSNHGKYKIYVLSYKRKK